MNTASMNDSASNFDADRFAKVRVMMDRGATDGERAAARTRAEAMAQRAGMTLKQAMSKMDRKAKAEQQKPPASTNGFSDIFHGFDDHMEAKHPGWKAKEARKKAEREATRAQRRKEALNEFGTASAIFDLTAIERALYEAAAPFAKREWNDGWIEGRFAFTQELGGHNVDNWLEKTPPFVVDVIRNAWPLPETLPGLMAEVRMWDDLRWRRGLFVEGEYLHHAEVTVREWLVEEELNTRPAASWDDVSARFEWGLYKEQRQFLDPKDGGLDPFDERLRQDFEILRARYEARPVADTPTRRTNADKRSDVLSMLDANPELSDREISRRCGVSPQTVNTWRHKRADGGPDQ